MLAVGDRSRQQYVTLQARVAQWLSKTRATLEAHTSWEGQPPELRTESGSWVDVEDLLTELEQLTRAPH